MAYSYRAYGLNLHSELPLPELSLSDGNADVVIRHGTVDRSPPDDYQFPGCYHASSQEALLYWNDSGKFAVRGGREIVLDPIPEADARILRLLILGPAMSAILHQRGFVVLHASAVAIDGEAVAFVGGSGWGKSTMAAAMHARGHGIVTDDVATVDVMRGERPMVYPAFAQQKLWPDSAASLGLDPDALPLLEPALEKRVRPVFEGYSENPLPLRRIYILAKREARVIERLSPNQAFAQMVRHSYSTVARIIEMSGGAVAHFPQCVKLVTAVPICRLGRPPSLEMISDIARWVEEDIAQHA